MSRQTGVICALREVGDRLTSQMVDTPQRVHLTSNLEGNSQLGVQLWVGFPSHIPPLKPSQPL